METLKIPEKYLKNIDTELAYENGFYDGRDEGYADFTPFEGWTNFVKDYRIEKDLSRQQLAIKTRSSVSTVTNWLQGAHSISVRTMTQILDILGYELWLHKKE